MRPCVLRPPVRDLPFTSDFSGSRAGHLVARRARSRSGAPGVVGLCFLIAMRYSAYSARSRRPRTARCARRAPARRSPSSSCRVRPDGPAAALGLRAHLHRAHVDHPDVEDLLDRGTDLRLVRVGVDPERVLVLGDQGVALLRDHGAGGSPGGRPSAASAACRLGAWRLGSRSRASTSSAASETTTAAAADHVRDAGVRAPAARRHAVEVAERLARRSPPRRPAAPAPARPFGRKSPSARRPAWSRARRTPRRPRPRSLPRRACTLSAARSARRRALRLTFTV